MRYRKKKQKKIIIISFLCLMLFLCVGYAAFSTNLSITAKGNIKEKSRIIKAWNYTDQTDFHSDFYKQNIVSVTFLDNNNIPSNKVESWNISEDKENGGVLAWVIPNNNDNTKYDLYIGAKDGVIANIDSSNIFYNFINLETVNFNNNYDTSNTNSMLNFFKWCYKLKNIDIENLNTSQVTDMSLMFYFCESLTELDLSNFITDKVTNMSYMFEGCSSLKTLNISSFNTSNVTDMSNMFKACKSLIDLNVSNFNTSKVTNMNNMFHSLSLSTLDISNFDTRKVTQMYSMFQYSTNLKTIYVGSNWTTENVQTYLMFDNCGTNSVTKI